MALLTCAICGDSTSIRSEVGASGAIRLYCTDQVGCAGRMMALHKRKREERAARRHQQYLARKASTKDSYPTGEGHG